MSKLYCFCGETYEKDERFMIQCDDCDTWYHGECVRISESAGKRLPQWYCRSCSNLKMRHNELQKKLDTIGSYLQKTGKFKREQQEIDQLFHQYKQKAEHMEQEVLRLQGNLNEKEEIEKIHSEALQQEKVVNEKNKKIQQDEIQRLKILLAQMSEEKQNENEEYNQKAEQMELEVLQLREKLIENEECKQRMELMGQEVLRLKKLIEKEKIHSEEKDVNENNKKPQQDEIQRLQILLAQVSEEKEDLLNQHAKVSKENKYLTDQVRKLNKRKLSLSQK